MDNQLSPRSPRRAVRGAAPRKISLCRCVSHHRFRDDRGARDDRVAVESLVLAFIFISLSRRACLNLNIQERVAFGFNLVDSCAVLDLDASRVPTRLCRVSPVAFLRFLDRSLALTPVSTHTPPPTSNPQAQREAPYAVGGTFVKRAPGEELQRLAASNEQDSILDTRRFGHD